MPDNIKLKGNILLVANWNSDVGYAWWLMENFWTSIATHFEKKNVRCHLVYPKITSIPDSIAATDIVTAELSFSNHSARNLLRICRYIKKNSIRYIYMTDSPFYSWRYLLLRMCGIKKIVIHDHTPGERSTPPAWLKILKKLVQIIPYINADHFIAVTDFVHQRHLQVNHIPANKCSVAANGIHPYDLSHIDNNYAQQHFDIKANKKIVVTTGRASIYKGIDFFIRCADELINKQQLKQLHFLFCGDGPEMAQFTALCKKHELEKYFTFAGKRTDIKKILPACDIGFHAAHGEVGYSLSILEYMSAGLATVVPDNPSTSCATRHGETGLLYLSGNIDSACAAITRCLDDKFREKLASNAIAAITQHFDIKSTNQALLSTLDKVYT